jgi:hypothetical protein
MIQRQHVEPNFFEEGEALRGVLDASFDKPYVDSIKWILFSVPQLYNYLRSPPKDVFPAPLFERFMSRLRGWTFEKLGLVPMGDPNLLLMVNGHYQPLHSDFHNGVWGYVYSLTRWDRRTFAGGETLLLRDGIPSYKKHHAHGSSLYDLVPAEFNQLLVFDDRVVHAVPTIEGAPNPKDGRIAMVGHIRATGTKVKGPLPADVVRQVVAEALPRIAEQLRPFKDIQGTMSYRLRTAPDGTVASIEVLTNNLVIPVTGYGNSDAVTAAKAKIQAVLKGLRFPPAPDGSAETLPILVPIPEQRPIEVKVPHALSPSVVYARLEQLLPTLGDNTVQGVGKGGVEFRIQEPIDGTIRIETDAISASFEAPMWVPSQRAQFEVHIAEGLTAAARAPA